MLTESVGQALACRVFGGGPLYTGIWRPPRVTSVKLVSLTQGIRSKLEVLQAQLSWIGLPTCTGRMPGDTMRVLAPKL